MLDALVASNLKESDLGPSSMLDESLVLFNEIEEDFDLTSRLLEG